MTTLCKYDPAAYKLEAQPREDSNATVWTERLYTNLEENQFHGIWQAAPGVHANLPGQETVAVLSGTATVTGPKGIPSRLVQAILSSSTPAKLPPGPCTKRCARCSSSTFERRPLLGQIISRRTPLTGRTPGNDYSPPRPLANPIHTVFVLGSVISRLPERQRSGASRSPRPASLLPVSQITQLSLPKFWRMSYI